MNRVPLRGFAAVIGLCAALPVATGVRADETPSPTAGTQPAPQPLDTIVVTGSHIHGVDLENQHPLLTIDRAAIERTGLSSISDVVQAIVANGETLNRNINNGGNGEQLVNLRSLGSNRTLVLLNGQRFVTDIDGAVDLSAIPLALVDHIDVLLDGASAIHGSDAIAGVVNIVTRRNFEGGELGAYAGGNDHGDGARHAADLSVGNPDYSNLCTGGQQTKLIAGNEVPWNHVGGVAYTDVEVGWEAPWRARITFGVRNALDRSPPAAYSAFANSFFPDYDVPGRFNYASYRQSFPRLI